MGSGLVEYVQLFVISNGTHTKYYLNTTRNQHLKDQQKRTAPKASNSFEVTSINYKQLGTVAAGEYIWHTTGSGKTLISFKTAQLATMMPGIDKVIFVVDRKDLDYQTMRKYDRFQKGAANSNTSTTILKRRFEDPSAKIIITTIQKLSTFIHSNKNRDIYNQHVVIVFDECHRSQFGDMDTDITRAFKRYHLFGFTGTPIFAANRGSSGNPKLRTTGQAFGDKLYTYSVVDAISNMNVLPFRVDYINTMRVGNPEDREVTGIDTEKAPMAPERISQIVRYTLEHFDQKTKRESSYEHSVVVNVSESTRVRHVDEAIRQCKRARGFNAIFVAASIDAARRYYNEFQRNRKTWSLTRSSRSPSSTPTGPTRRLRAAS
ncbi:DEAD/DEAH box helicase family protein [Cutibacterium sp. V947]|uniref:DEAD/DEAH box helicase family protein n=1 Tax=unclassified Cutibacterium TaxID=2649671 RepID=UPI003EE10765